MTSLMLTVQYMLQSRPPGGTLPPESLGKNLERIRHSAERLQRLSDQLLDVTRIERGRLDIDPVTLELGGLVQQVVEDLKFELHRAGCAVEIDVSEPAWGSWDRSRLEQVVTNLLSNALKFGRGHPIEIRIRSTDDLVEMTVRDHGIGIEPGRRPFIFDRFARGVSAAQYGGLGLGLYIANTIVCAHRGHLRVESEPGCGATFIMTLPRAPRAPASIN
jgi:signal transduction histidine kinase